MTRPHFDDFIEATRNPLLPYEFIVECPECYCRKIRKMRDRRGRPLGNHPDQRIFRCDACGFTEKAWRFYRR